MYSIKIKSVATIIAAFTIISNISAQQIFKVSQYQENSFINNPAAAGANNVTTIGGVFRSQWEGISGGPQTGILFGDTYFSSKATGVGVILYSDKTGPTSRTGGELNFSYSVKLDGDQKRLMMGLGVQMLQFRVDKDKIAEFIPNDPLLASSGSATKADFSAGIYLKLTRFSFGISAKQLLEPKLNFIKSATNVEGKLYRHFFLNTSYRLSLDEDNTLIPHFEWRYQPNAPSDYEGGLLLDHKDLFHFGASLHHKQNYTVFAGVKLNHKFSIGYAYDNYNHPIDLFDGGNAAHEFMLRYFFTK